jgi:predicted nucleic acid-binding protein
MKRTYVDASVLIAAFQGQGDTSRLAMAVLDDPERRLVVSDYLRLEVVPKPAFLRRDEEVQFMETVLAAGEAVLTSPDLTRGAVHLACRYDMKPIDALHVSAALTGNADELVTMEKHEKPICRVREILVVSLHPKSRT